MPTGFLLLGMLLATLGTGCTLAVAGVHSNLLSRALFGLVAILSLVLVEALWWVRPWVVRAVDAWAAMCFGAVLFSLLIAWWDEEGLAGALAIALLVLCFVGLPCALVRWYVRDHARKLGLAPRAAAVPTARVAVPTPHL